MSANAKQRYEWLAPTVRWIQFGFLVTSTMLVGRASRIILNHEYDAARISNQHETSWGKKLDETRERHDVSAYGDDVWFIVIIITWVIIAVVLSFQFLKHRFPGRIKDKHHLAVIRIALSMGIGIGLYLFVMSIIIHEDFRQIECPIDQSARDVIDATSRDVYVTCMKQDYTEDLFRGIFGPLFVLLTLEMVLVACTHWTVEEIEIKGSPPGYSKVDPKSGPTSHIGAPPATSITTRLFF